MSATYCLFGVQYSCLPSSDWAAWVQAIGTVIAILASAAVVIFQHRLQEKGHHRREVRSKIEAVHSLLHLIEQMIELANLNVKSMLSGTVITEFDFEAVVFAHVGLRDISNGDAPCPALIPALIMARQGADHVFNAARILYGRLKFGNNLEGDPQALMESGMSRINAAALAFRQEKTKLEAQLLC